MCVWNRTSGDFGLASGFVFYFYFFYLGVTPKGVGLSGSNIFASLILAYYPSRTMQRVNILSEKYVSIYEKNIKPALHANQEKWF